MGEAVTEQLHIEVKAKVLQNVRFKYACRHCDRTGIPASSGNRSAMVVFVAIWALNHWLFGCERLARFPRFRKLTGGDVDAVPRSCLGSLRVISA
jgi:hypothetical protein